MLFRSSKNLILFTNECTAMDESVKPSEKFSEFEKKRITILKEMSEKDKNGNPVFIGDPTRPQFKIQEDKIEIFNKEMLVLTEDYKEEIEKRNKMLIDFDKMLGEEVSEEFKKQIFKFNVTLDTDGMPSNLPKGLKQKFIDPLLNIIIVEK